MDRREFIKNAALLGAGMAVTPAWLENALAADGPLVVKGRAAARRSWCALPWRPSAA